MAVIRTSREGVPALPAWCGLHVHGRQYVYPQAAGAVVVTAGNPAWTVGGLVTIIPAATVASSYDVHAVTMADIATSPSRIQLWFYTGGGATYVGTAMVRKFYAGMSGGAVDCYACQTILISANGSLEVRSASDVALNTCNLRVYYHLN